jgi:hypothetical protein
MRPRRSSTESVLYLRIWSDADGESHLEEIEIPLARGDYAPPAPALDLSEAMAAEQVLFCSFPVGWFGDWHPSPRRQLYFNLGGELEVTVSDGAVRRLQPGDIVLTEDVDGRGHITRVIGETPSVGAFVHLDAGELD